MSNKILLITPPDKLFNQNNSCLLIYPSIGIRQQTEKILANSTNGHNVYLYNVEPNVEEGIEHDIDWLLTVSKMCETVILDLDNCPLDIRMLGSYFVSLPNTYWLTSEDNLLYNKLSPNRIYGLDTIENLIGGSVEQQEEI